jgi:cytochrome c1
MRKNEPKICVKCGEYYFGEHCVGCHSNQYAHYNADSSIKNKLLIGIAILIIIGLILINR